jgi:hypothetical protein
MLVHTFYVKAYIFIAYTYFFIDSTYFGLVKAGLKLSHLNIRNLLPKLDEIKQFKFAYQKNNTHIFGVCEIFLTEDITNDMISIEGFALERKDRSEARHKLGGGLTIYFSDLLNHQRRKDLEISNLESIWCQVDLQNSKPLLICYVYRPPDMHQSWIDDFGIVVTNSNFWYINFSYMFRMAYILIVNYGTCR